jgi:GT2 family glycosyltransferase
MTEAAPLSSGNVCMTVGIILVNYTGWQTTVKGLQALKTLDYPDFHVIVVDNASPDDSAQQLDGLQELLGFTLINNSENAGYSGGNNVGIRYAIEQLKCQAVWLLNNDTKASPDSLTALITEVQTHGEQALYGSLLRYPDGRYQQAGIRLNPWTGQLRGYPQPADNISDSSVLPVDAIGGASLLIPTPVIQSSGYLPEEYFLYAEDVAYALQAKANGCQRYIVPSSVVIHDEGATVSGNNSYQSSPSPMAQYYYQRNRFAVLWRWLPWPQKLTMAGYSLVRWARLGLKALFNSERHRHGFQLFHRGLIDAALGRLGKVPFQRLNP